VEAVVGTGLVAEVIVGVVEVIVVEVIVVLDIVAGSTIVTGVGSLVVAVGPNSVL